jgi:hypothetical protein
MGLYVIGIGIAFAVGALLPVLFGFEDKKQKEEERITKW